MTKNLLKIKLNLLLFISLLALLSLAVPSVNGETNCYKCTVTHPYHTNETKRLCSEFDNSKKYQVNCPYSSMCMKKIYYLKLLDGTDVTTIIRDCANQKLVKQVFKNRDWVKETIVEEFYSEGCELDKSNNAEICHCRGQYCNSTPSSNDNTVSTDVMTVLLLFNLFKYLRTTD